jgi:3-oxosteroid 1-dehydrogenase
MQLPARDVPNVDLTHPMFFDHRHPHSVCVNRLGSRFVNESCSYDRFGIAMIDDQRRTGANVPCWMIFDATYRRKYACGGIMPSSVMPDREIPPDWWDNYVYRADSIEALAGKFGLEGGRLAQVISEMNRYAATGVDLEFNRGAEVYDRYFGDARVTPNPCLGAIEERPFYAISISEISAPKAGSRPTSVPACSIAKANPSQDSTRRATHPRRPLAIATRARAGLSGRR